MTRAKKLEIPLAFHPAEYLREELEERGVTAKWLAKQSCLEYESVVELLAQRRSVDHRASIRLGMALGVSPRLFLNLQEAYDKAQKQQGGSR